MADVNITVGASIAGLTNALNEASAKLDKFKSGIEAAFALGGITALVSEMAKLGEEATRAAAMLGVSTESAQLLGLVAQASGGSLESITSQLVRLQVGLERGSKETSIQAAALRALGIDVKTFISTPVDKQLNLFADAVHKLSEEGKNAAPALALISRGLAQMMPELEQGSAHLEEFKQKAIDAGAIVSQQTTRDMDILNGELVILWGSLKALGQVIVEAVSPQIIQFAHEVEQATLKLSAQLVTGTLLKNLWEEFTIRLQRSIAFLSGNTAEVAKMDAALAHLNGTIEQTVKDYTAMLQAAANAVGKVAVNVKMPGADRDAMKSAEEDFKRLSELYNEQYKTYQITEAQKTELLRQALLQREQAEIKAGENSVVAEKKFEADWQKVVDQMTEHTVSAWKNMADSLASDFSTALDEVLTKQKSFGAAMGQMFGKMVEKMIADLIKLILEYTILKAVAGTALAPNMQAPGFGALAQQVFPILGGIGGAATNAAQQAALGANTAAIIANTGAHTAGTGVVVGQTAATSSLTAATGAHITVLATHVVATETQTAAQLPNTAATIANTFATELNTIKGFFPGFASGSWNVPKAGFPSYDVGTSNAGAGLAILHAGEMVIPAGPAASIRSGNGGIGVSAGGGGNVQLTISALDASSFASWLRGGGGNMLSRFLSQQWQNNPSMRPGFVK